MEQQTTEAKPRRVRQSNITPEMLEKMRELEAQGIKRVDIGRRFGYSAAAITRRLGKRQ